MPFIRRRTTVVEQVKDRRLFHLSSPAPYKQPLALSQAVRTDKNNPFFHFYESVVELPVTDSATGQIVQVNIDDWIQRVKNGSIATTLPILADVAHRANRHYRMLSRELIMEEIRRDEFQSKPPSRQKCLYLCDSIAEAQAWIPFVGNGAICELSCTGTILRTDSNLLLARSEPLSKTREAARAYWRGESSASPRHETLFVGEAIVVGVGL